MKLDALKALVKSLRGLDLALDLDPGTQQVAREIANELTNFITDNEPPTLAAVTQDAIDAARFRKLRAAHCGTNGDAAVRFRVNEFRSHPDTMIPDRFDAFVDSLPS